jgi:ATP-dependent DNA helicase PIF1
LAIDFRLRQIRPQFQDIPFGGVSVVLFGDFGQLPPVIDSALYQSPTEKSPLTIHQTSQLYRSTFSRAFNLTQQMRQQGQTEMDNKFQEALGHLRLGSVTKADWEFFQSRVLANLSLEDQQRFEQSTFLFTTNADVVERNISMLEKVTHPNRAVARIEAKYHGISMEEGAKVESDYCNGLEHVLHVCVDARVPVTLRTKSNRTSC